MSETTLDPQHSISETAQNPVEKSLSQAQETALSKLEFFDLNNSDLPLTPERLNQISQTTDRVTTQSDKDTWLIQGIGNNTLYLHQTESPSHRIKKMIFLDTQTATGVDVLSLDRDTQAYVDYAPIPPRGMRSVAHARNEWYSTDGYINVPGNDLNDGYTPEEIPILTILAPSHEIWHQIAGAKGIKNKLLYSLSNITFLQRLFRHDTKKGSWEERSAMHFSVKFVRRCQENGVCLFRDMDKNKIVARINSTLHW